MILTHQEMIRKMDGITMAMGKKMAREENKLSEAEYKAYQDMFQCFGYCTALLAEDLERKQKAAEEEQKHG